MVVHLTLTHPTEGEGTAGKPLFSFQCFLCRQIHKLVSFACLQINVKFDGGT